MFELMFKNFFGTFKGHGRFSGTGTRIQKKKYVQIKSA